MTPLLEIDNMRHQQQLEMKQRQTESQSETTVFEAVTSIFLGGLLVLVAVLLGLFLASVLAMTFTRSATSRGECPHHQ